MKISFYVCKDEHWQIFDDFNLQPFFLSNTYVKVIGSLCVSGKFYNYFAGGYHHPPKRNRQKIPIIC